MKKIIFVLIFSLGLGQVLFAQADEYQSGVIILTDGRIIAMRGDYEHVGDEIHFLDDRGERVALQARLVDIETTDEQNRLIREKSKDPHSIKDDGSLYSKIKRDQERKASGLQDPKNKKRNLTQEDIPAQQGKKKPVFSMPQSNNDGINLDPQRARQMAETYFNELKDKLPISSNVLVALLAILVFLGFLSFITEIYILFTSYYDSLMWGLTITFFTVGSFFIPFLAAVLLGASGSPLLSLIINAAFFLGRIITIVSYIVVIFTGNRLRLFLFWSASFWFALAAGIIIGVMMI